MESSIDRVGLVRDHFVKNGLVPSTPILLSPGNHFFSEIESLTFLPHVGLENKGEPSKIRNHKQHPTFVMVRLVMMSGESFRNESSHEKKSGNVVKSFDSLAFDQNFTPPETEA